MTAMSAQKSFPAWRILLTGLTVLLLLLLAMPVGAAAQDRPAPPADPWAADRPDDNGGKVDLGWADSLSPDIAAYRVYRAQRPGGPYALLSERSTASGVNYLGYVDTGLSDGTTYYYAITAVDSLGRESGYSPELPATPQAQRFEAAVSVQKSMVLSIAEQKLYCMENGRVVYVFRVSSGAGGTPTPTGNFKILYHDQAHPVPKYPGCVCYYWMGFYADYAIHAWPTYNGVQSNYEGLGYPASHGCVRLDPTQAHIPFYWAPDGTPLSIIAGNFQQPPAPIQGGHVSRGTDEAAKTWYFAEGYTGVGFNEYVCIFNPQEQVAAFDIDMMLPDGSVHTQPFTVGAKSRITLNVDDFQGMSDTNVSVRIRSQQPVVAERAMYFDYNGKTGGHVSLGVTEPSPNWYFAEGYTGGGFDEYILVLNPNAQDAVVTFDFMKPDGSVYSEDFPVGANSRATVNVDAVPGMDNTNVSVKLTSGIPVVAERAMYFGYNGIDGGTVSTGASQPSLEWYFAEGYTGGGFNEYILVLNPNHADAQVTFDFMKPDGSVYTQVFPAAANGRTTVYVDAAPGMDSTDVSVKLTSSIPVVAERSMYFGYPECPGGHVQAGTIDPGIIRYFAEGYTSRFFDTYLLVMNPGDGELPVVVTFCRPDGTYVKQPMMVGAHSRASLKVNLVPNLSSSEFSIRVDTGGPAVIERAMYFSYPR
jgi:lipoprotein-anchoring transpeptidase ErfK/SrfK/diaminopimelate epimerase